MNQSCIQNPLAISLGDPAGIGPEIIVKALAESALAQRCLIFGDAAVLSSTASRLGLPIPANIESVTRLATVPTPGHASPATGDAAWRYVVAAAQAVLDGRCQALCTAPISKESMRSAGHDYPGHTELLAELAGGAEVRMMLANDALRTVLVSVHLPLRQAINGLSRDGICRTLEIADAGLKRIGIARPRLAVAGLNPHAGENGLFGHEEIDIIAPAIADACSLGIDASGPFPPDTVFMQARGFERFDAVIAMYHDQGLIPIKFLGLDNGVNITLGLPFIRTSPDHGTAFDIAGQNLAEPSSMACAIRMALSLGGIQTT